MPLCRPGSLPVCPYLHGPKRGQSHQVIRFGFYGLKRGRRRRYRCSACGQTYGRILRPFTIKTSGGLPALAGRGIGVGNKVASQFNQV
jgi:hypothetical protein